MWLAGYQRQHSISHVFLKTAYLFQHGRIDAAEACGIVPDGFVWLDQLIKQQLQPHRAHCLKTGTQFSHSHSKVVNLVIVIPTQPHFTLQQKPL